jgi:hypothetical protein
MKYTLIVETGSEAYWGYFPDVPGCTVGSETLDGIVSLAGKVLCDHLAGSEAPRARTRVEVLSDPEVIENSDGSEFTATVEYHAESVPAL